MFLKKQRLHLYFGVNEKWLSAVQLLWPVTLFPEKLRIVWSSFISMHPQHFLSSLMTYQSVCCPNIFPLKNIFQALPHCLCCQTFCSIYYSFLLALSWLILRHSIRLILYRFVNCMTDTTYYAPSSSMIGHVRG
jgi:hypothetical protein